MAELSFDVRANYDEVIRLREELDRLREEMLKMDTTTDAQKEHMEQLEQQYADTTAKMNGLVDQVAQGAQKMGNEMSDGISKVTVGYDVLLDALGAAEEGLVTVIKAKEKSGEIDEEMATKMKAVVAALKSAQVVVEAVRKAQEARAAATKVVVSEEKAETTATQASTAAGKKSEIQILAEGAAKRKAAIEAERKAIAERRAAAASVEETAAEAAETAATAGLSATQTVATGTTLGFAASVRTLSAAMEANPLGLALTLLPMVIELVGGLSFDTDSLTMEVNDLNKELREELERLDDLYGTITDANTKTRDRKDALDELNEMCKEYNVTLINENDTLEQQRIKYEKLAVAIRNANAEKIGEKYIDRAQAKADEKDESALEKLKRQAGRNEDPRVREIEDYVWDQVAKRVQDRVGELSGLKGEAYDKKLQSIVSDVEKDLQKNSSASSFAIERFGKSITKYVKSVSKNATEFKETVADINTKTKNFVEEVDPTVMKVEDASFETIEAVLGEYGDDVEKSTTVITELGKTLGKQALETKLSEKAIVGTRKELKDRKSRLEKEIDSLEEGSEQQKRLQGIVNAIKDELKTRTNDDGPGGGGGGGGGKKKGESNEEEARRKELEEHVKSYTKYGNDITKLIAKIEDDITRTQIAAIDDRDAAVRAQLDYEKEGLLARAREVGQAMTDLYKGNVDLLNREQIPLMHLADAGWDVGIDIDKIDAVEKSISELNAEIGSVNQEMADLPDVIDHPEVQATVDALIAREEELKAKISQLTEERNALIPDSYATLYSMQEGIKDSEGDVHEILFTPILPDGTVLTPDVLNEYIHDMLEGAEDILEADKRENGGLGIVISVDSDLGGQKLHEMQEDYYELIRVIKEYMRLKEEKAESEKMEAEKKAMDDYLRQYGTYEEKKLTIQKTYEEKAKKASTTGERLALARQEQKELNNLEKTYNRAYSLIFADADSLSNNLLADAITATQDAIEEAKESGDIQSLTELYARLREQMAVMGDRNRSWGFKGIAEGFGLRADANEKRALAAELEQSLAKREEDLDFLKDSGIDPGQIENARKKIQELREEINNLKESATIDDQQAKGFIGKGFDEMTSAFSQLGSAMSSFADGKGGVMDTIAELGQGLQGHASEIKEAFSGDMASNGGQWSTIISGTIELVSMVGKAIQNNKKAQDEWNRSVEDGEHRYKMLMLDKMDYSQSNIFGVEDPFKRATMGAEQYHKAMEDITELTDKLGSAKVQTGTKKAVDRANVGKGAGTGAAVGAAVGTWFGPIGTAIGTAIGAGVGAIAGALSTKVVPVFEDLKSVYGELFDPNTYELNPKILADYDKLDEDTKQIVDHWDEIKQKASDARKELKDNLKDFSGNLGTQLEDMLVKAWESRRLYSAVDEFKRYVGQQIGTILEQRAFSAIFEGLFTDLGKQMEQSFLGPNADYDITDEMTELTKVLPQYLEAYGTVMDQMNEQMEEMGYGGLRQAQKNVQASSNSAQNITETTGSAIQGGVTALRLSSEVRNERLSLMSATVDEMLRQQLQSTTLAEDIRNIAVDSYLALKAIRDNTEGNLTAVRGIAEDVSRIEKATRGLS